MRHIYPWQQQEWQSLLNYKNNGQIPHAILIKGQLGLGKYHFARCFAETLLCQNLISPACGNCNSCKLLASDNHPDLMIVQPEENNKLIKIEQIRETVAWLYNTSQNGGYKIVIINQAEMLNIASANSLLKTLEEPPANVVMLLVTHNTSMLPATIISRCQPVIIKTPSYHEAKSWLQGETNYDNPKLILDLVGNAPLKALSYIQDGQMQKRHEVFEFLRALQKKQISIPTMAVQCLKLLEIKDLLAIFMAIISDMIKIKFTINNITNSDHIEELKKISMQTNLANLFFYHTQLVKLQQHIVGNINVNQQLSLENLIINWAQLFGESNQVKNLC